MLRPIVLGISSGFAALLFVGLTPLIAQEAAPAKKAEVPAARKSVEPGQRVPDYFGQIGLTAVQREQIYAVRVSHQKKIDELERQIAESKSKMLIECEAVLTPSQKEMVKHRREAAKEVAKAAKQKESTKAPG